MVTGLIAAWIRSKLASSSQYRDGLSGIETIPVDGTHLPPQSLSGMRQGLKITFDVIHPLSK